VKGTTVGVFLWLFASVVWGQSAGQGPQDPLGQRSGGPSLAAPAVPGAGPAQVAQRLRRFDEGPPPGSERIPSTPPSELEDRLIFEPVLDRWRIGYKRNILDPYNQNVLKGDYPIPGTQNLFFVFTAISDTLAEGRSLPVPSGVSAARADSIGFFGDGGQVIFRENLLLRFELYRGDTAFKPPDFLLTITPAFNFNYADLEERGGVNIDVRQGTNRARGDAALQEGSFEYHIANLSDRYDSISVKLGIQPFNSDFRGFIFNDTNLGIRLFGNLGNNRYQYNLAFFDMLEKQTNSELNTFDRRDQRIVIANLYWQDLFALGYTTQFNLHYVHDKATLHFDANGFLVRPDPVGVFTPHELNVVYLGWTSSGHIGLLNVTHALYQAVGTDTRNPLAGRRVTVNAQFAALELSIDRDWLRPIVSFTYASGDRDPTSGTAHGFDSIFDKPNFAGGDFSFWNRQGIRLLGVGLVQAGSFFPDLRSSKIEGQPNFVNPGLVRLHAGLEAEVTPKVKTLFNASYLRFATVQPLQHFLQQPKIGHDIGFDLSLGLIYRPLLNNNIILTGGVAAFIPGNGFRDALTSETLFQGFLNARFLY
jgi:hypothetical protein